MKTFGQYTLAKLGMWKPEIGAVYQADENFKSDPFKPDHKPNQVVVLDVQGEHVQYRNVRYENSIDSNTITGFASYWIKVKND